MGPAFILESFPLEQLQLRFA